MSESVPKVPKICPKCGLPGYGSYPKTFHGKSYLYFAHNKVNGLTPEGKAKRGIKWCYIKKVEAVAVAPVLEATEVKVEQGTA